MKTVAVIAQKGGAGKTTIATNLAVRAADDFSMVAMVDMNHDQANLTQWCNIREGLGEIPALFSDVEDLVKDLPRLEHNGWQLCLIDAPPSYSGIIETCVMAADAVIVPVKISMFDAGSLQPVVEMVKRHRKPYAVVLSDVDSRFKTQIAQVTEALKADGLPLLSGVISHLQAYQVAPNLGKTGAELDDKAAAEIDALWAEVCKLAGLKVAKKGKRQ